MESKAFVSAAPSKLRKHSSSKDQCHPRICKLRSSAAEQSKYDDAHEDTKLRESKKKLETLVKLEMRTTGEKKDGKCTCIWCEGAKKRKCSWCKGKGVRYEMADRSWAQLADDLERLESGELQAMPAPEKVPVVCSACKGTKQLRCAYCHGSGIGSYGHAY